MTVCQDDGSNVSEDDMWTRTVPLSDPIQVRISERFGDDEIGLGGTIWSASVKLGTFLTGPNSPLRKSHPSTPSTVDKTRRTRILELGSGCGVVGIGCAKLGFDVTMTDAMSVDLLSYNLSLNTRDIQPSVSVHVRELEWTRASQYILSHIFPKSQLPETHISSEPDSISTISTLRSSHLQGEYDWILSTRFSTIIASECCYTVPLTRSFLTFIFLLTRFHGATVFMCGVIGDDSYEYFRNHVRVELERGDVDIGFVDENGGEVRFKVLEEQGQGEEGYSKRSIFWTRPRKVHPHP